MMRQNHRARIALLSVIFHLLEFPAIPKTLPDGSSEGCRRNGPEAKPAEGREITESTAWGEEREKLPYPIVFYYP